ncbi:MAG: VirE protein [Bacteroidia bacterium]
MDPTKKAILDKTNYGINIYSHILRKYYPNETVLTLSGKGCEPTRNPFDNSKYSLWIRIVNGCAVHVDANGAIENGDVFDFAKRHYECSDEELLDILDVQLNLGIRHDWHTAIYSPKRDLVMPVPEAPILMMPRFSFFKRPITNTKPEGTKGLLEIYEFIKGDKYKQVTNRLRSFDDFSEARRFKASNFDYATFSGEFSYRSDSGLIEHSGLLCLDFDDIDLVDDLKQALLDDEYFETELLFVSPSGNGVKWVISIDQRKGDHKYWFAAVANYLKHTYQVEVDASGKDVSRACFLPHDPNVVINPKHLGR